MPNLDTNGYLLNPSPGIGSASIVPSPGIEAPPVVPGDGTMRGVFGSLSIPGDGNHLEEPSTPARREGRGMEGEDAKTAAAQREQHSVDGQHQGDDDQGMQLAQAVVQRAAQAAGSAVAP